MCYVCVLNNIKINSDYLTPLHFTSTLPPPLALVAAAVYLLSQNISTNEPPGGLSLSPSFLVWLFVIVECYSTTTECTPGLVCCPPSSRYPSILLPPKDYYDWFEFVGCCDWIDPMDEDPDNGPPPLPLLAAVMANECDDKEVTDCGIFSRKSSASTDSISARQFFTSLSTSLNWYGGQAMLSVEKNP